MSDFTCFIYILFSYINKDKYVFNIITLVIFLLLIPNTHTANGRTLNCVIQPDLTSKYIHFYASTFVCIHVYRNRWCTRYKLARYQRLHTNGTVGLVCTLVEYHCRGWSRVQSPVKDRIIPKTLYKWYQ